VSEKEDEKGSSPPFVENNRIEREVEMTMSLRNADAEIFWDIPPFGRIQLEIPPSVYPPREDTRLAEAAMIRELHGRKMGTMLEIGTGSGVLAARAAAMGWEVTAVDVNPFAVAAARALVDRLDLSKKCEVLEMDILQPTHDFGRQFDVILWNTPYLEPMDDQLGPIEEAGFTRASGMLDLLRIQVEGHEWLRRHGAVILLVALTPNTELELATLLSSGWALRPITEAALGSDTVRAVRIWKPWSGRAIDYTESVESTNSQLLEEGGEIGRLLRADVQTKGKGRMSRRWSTEKGAFAGSWLITGPKTQTEIGRLQISAGLAVIDALASHLGKPLSILSASAMRGNPYITLKWPNDVLIHGQKAAGILVEARSRGDNTICALGIGVNLSIAPKGAGSTTDLGLNLCVDDFASTLDASLSSWLEEIRPPISVSYLRHAACEAMAWWSSDLRVLQIDEKFQLVVEDGGKIVTLKSPDQLSKEDS